MLRNILVHTKLGGSLHLHILLIVLFNQKIKWVKKSG